MEFLRQVMHEIGTRRDHALTLSEDGERTRRSASPSWTHSGPNWSSTLWKPERPRPLPSSQQNRPRMRGGN
jgi:hypothetical protein